MGEFFNCGDIVTVRDDVCVGVMRRMLVAQVTTPQGTSQQLVQCHWYVEGSLRVGTFLGENLRGTVEP